MAKPSEYDFMRAWMIYKGDLQTINSETEPSEEEIERICVSIRDRRPPKTLKAEPIIGFLLHQLRPAIVDEPEAEVRAQEAERGVRRIIRWLNTHDPDWIARLDANRDGYFEDVGVNSPACYNRLQELIAEET